MFCRIVPSFLTATFLLMAVTGQAGEFRSLDPVKPSRAVVSAWQTAPGDLAVKGLPSKSVLDQLAREARTRAAAFVRQGLAQMFEAWKDGQIERFLSPRFYDRQRFLDAMLRDVPRDARIRLLAIESVQPFEQANELLDAATQAAPTALPKKLLLRVRTKLSAIVRTQVEYNDARNGFQRREGRNEFFVELAQDIPLLPQR